MESMGSAKPLSPESRALDAQAKRYTVRIADATDLKAGGSAVPIQMGNRYFLATAGHVIRECPELVIVSETPGLGHRDFVASHLDIQKDIGLLELSAASALSLGIDFLPSTSIRAGFKLDETTPLVISGFPGGSAEVVQGHTITKIIFTAFVFHVEPLIPPYKKELKIEDADTCIFCRFREKIYIGSVDPNMCEGAENVREEKFPDVAGISGCGVWRANVDMRSGIWEPSLELLAIEISWFEEKGWIRSRRIDDFLSLVEANYSDLIEVVNSVRRGSN